MRLAPTVQCNISRFDGTQNTQRSIQYTILHMLLNRRRWQSEPFQVPQFYWGCPLKYGYRYAGKPTSLL